MKAMMESIFMSFGNKLFLIENGELRIENYERNVFDHSQSPLDVFRILTKILIISSQSFHIESNCSLVK